MEVIILHTRIKNLRKTLNLTQEEFAAKIGLSRNFIAQVESGLKNPSDRTISDICREFGVNEKWLRFNDGDIYKSSPPAGEVNNAIANMLEDIGCDNSVYTLVKEFLLKYDRLDSKSKEVINKFADDVVNGYTKKREDA